MLIERVSIRNFFQLINKILKIKNLKKLVIKNCKFEEEQNPIETNKTKLSLDSLVLHSNQIFNNQLNYLLSSIINLINFECKDENSVNKFLCNPEFSSSIKELNLHSSSNGSDQVFNSNHFNLNTFSYHCDRPTVNLNKLESFLTKQTNLIYLGINFNPNNFSQLFSTFKSICSRIKTIKYISYSFGYQKINNLNDLDFIWKLKGVELTRPLPSFFTSLKNESKLEELHLSTVSLEENIFDSFNFLPNLTSLFLYRTSLHNSVYQAIFQHLLQLRKLCIFDSQRVSLSVQVDKLFLSNF